MAWYDRKTICKVLKEQDPEQFETKLADLMAKRVKGEPVLKYEDGYFIAIVTYEEIEIPDDTEPVTEEFHELGIRYVCNQCPYLEKDGDKRRKYHKCKYAEYGMAREDQECCEYFYKLLKQGKIVTRF